jgi:serine/threonine protein kinase
MCPKGDFSEKELDDLCPDCGRPYGFPLQQAPSTIGAYAVLRPLQRGFYSATYVVERQGLLKTKQVIKIIPVEMYAHFEKDFDAECALHDTVAESAEHVVGISDLFRENVDFGGTVIPCHAAVLEYLDGHLLGDYLRGEQPLSAGTAAQIAADLFRMKAELERNFTNHNDLHADNIIVQRLSKGKAREGAMDPRVRAVAIDLGSVGADRRSGGAYRGDLHWIARHRWFAHSHVAPGAVSTRLPVSGI